ncbi:MAG: helicase [Marinilabiliales bacterium]|nr:MAG: helicase [Marinilabiliales bacterium]
MEKDTINNPELTLANNFVQFTDKHIFLTGKAGTGKTTFLQNLKNKLPKRMIVVAPTGVAAINAGGVTIHSFFQLPFGPIIPGHKESEAQKIMKFSAQKRNIIKSLDLLIIDEISMVRADLLDGIDEVLRRFRRSNEPFGGVQMLMIGDMQQLPPVVKDNEWSLLQKFYDTAFFFSSMALKKTSFVTINLKHVYRQKDEDFLDILNKIRDKQVDLNTLEVLNKRYKPDFKSQEDNYIILTTHNARAQSINNEKISEIKEKSFSFKAEVTGNFSEYNYPTDEILKLKKGSQVMFVKNDPEPDKKFFNGKIGVINHISNDEITVKCPDDDFEIGVSSLLWDNIKYTIDETTKEIKENIEGTFRQIPLKLAWAITIHKSQGLTFDKAIIDSEMAFAHGQVYVALSRCRSLEGLVLSTPFSENSLKSNYTIDSFTDTANANQPDEESLEKYKIAYTNKLLIDLFDFKKLRNHLQWFRKLTYENEKSLNPGLTDTLDKIQTRLNKDIYDVGERFQRQLNNLMAKVKNIESDADFQQRIKKGVKWFLEHINNSIVNEFENISVETDNKEIAGKINKAENSFKEELDYKTKCLESCVDGFIVREYLKSRAIAAMDEKLSKKKKSKKISPGKEVHNPDLYAVIKRWRDEKAKQNNLSHYMVLPLKSMRALSNFVPKTTDDLKMIHGLGRKKIDNYGDELLQLIKDFAEDHELKIEKPEAIPEKKKEPKIPSHEISFNLWKEYKDVEKIAHERGYVYSTILGHLANYIGKGIEITELVDETKVKTIMEVFKKDIDIPLGDALKIVGDDITYDDLRLVKHYAYLMKDNGE